MVAMAIEGILFILCAVVIFKIIRGIVEMIMDQHYTKEQYKVGIKIGGLCLVIISLICILGNNNQKPDSFINQILPPIILDDTMLSYGTILSIILVYYIIYRVYKLTDTKFLDETWKKLLAVILILGCLKPLPDSLIRLYRSHQEGVQSLYLYRNEMAIELKKEDGQSVNLKGKVRVENLGDGYRQFRMKIRLPKDWQDIVGLEWVEVYPEEGKMYEVGANDAEQLNFELNLRNKEQGESKITGSAYYVFEVMLYNEIDEAYFEVDAFDKRYYSEYK